MVIVLLVLENTRSIIADATNIIRSKLLNAPVGIVPYISIGNPSTTHILNILLPIILPTSRSYSPFLDDTIVVTNSGREVPKATIVNDITLSLSPNVLAILDALFTTRSLPIIMQARPSMINIIDLPSPNGAFSSSLSFFDLARVTR